MKITNELNLPQPFVSAVSREHTYTDKRYSATSLLKGTREAILQRRHADEIEQDVSDSIWLIFGNAVHSILEQAQETESQLKENWVSADMPNGYTVSGIFDLYDDSVGKVTDYKTATVWKVIFGEFDDYRKQVLIYCWILRQMGFDAHTGEIVMLLKDHSKTKAKTEANYPKHPVHIVSWEFTDNDFDEIGNWLEMKFLEIEAAEALPDDLLPLCTPDERWAKPPKYAVMKNQNKRATKLFDTEAEAQSFIDFHSRNSKDKFTIEKRPGTDGKCSEYCSVCEFCDYWRVNYDS